MLSKNLLEVFKMRITKLVFEIIQFFPVFACNSRGPVCTLLYSLQFNFDAVPLSYRSKTRER